MRNSREKPGGKKTGEALLLTTILPGNSKTRTLWLLKTGKSKSAGYCLMLSVLSTVHFRGEKLICFGVKNWGKRQQPFEPDGDPQIRRPAVKLSVLEVFDSILFPSEFSLNTFGTLYRTLPLYLSPSSCQLILNVAFRQLISIVASEHQKSIWR